MAKKKKPIPKSRKRRKPSQPPLFAVDDEVVVRSGVADPDFPDIPLGGWIGVVTACHILEREYIYDLQWTTRTLQNLPDIVKKRAERDGLDVERMTLGENELELYQGQPVEMEQSELSRFFHYGILLHNIPCRVESYGQGHA